MYVNIYIFAFNHVGVWFNLVVWELNHQADLGKSLAAQMALNLVSEIL